MTPPDDGMAVVAADLVSQARRVSVAADEIGTARQAGDRVRLNGDAYGQLCAVVPLLIDGLQQLLADALNVAETSLRDTDERLRQAARSHEDADAHREQVNVQLRDARHER
ncbi:type VII secretion target [Allorhizocola rhizosphaerae]|uniref:type VII secretion target n=1 Tax=Allorhizocola rhizosphaerae TaxID=1872709 RepID=UPI001FE73CDB|nr:type VII secretion target [Allorhizocola rhizosphaerae]